jgi:hypothetical protein
MKKLKIAILDQSMSDYVKLQHPKYRSKKYLEESFLYSVCMFFDETYTFLHFFNEDGTNQNVLEFISSAMSRNIKTLEPMQKHLKAKSIQHWKDKYMKTFTIPQYIVFQGNVYNLLMSKKEKIDYKKYEIHFDKQNENAEKNFLKLFVEIANKEFNIKLTKKQKKEVTESIFDLIKMNKLYID